MDERADVQEQWEKERVDAAENPQEEGRRENPLAEGLSTDGQGEPGGSGKRKNRKKGILAVSLAVLAAVCVVCIGMALFRGIYPKGYEDYTVQKEQHFVEYSEEYEYGEVLTVEYPVLAGIDQEVQQKINERMYEAAMDRVNYWHLHPSQEVQAFQKEYFSIFCSDVTADVTYHSQYLVSVDFYELYSAGNPLWYTNITERALTMDLLTGEIYGLADILEINRDFVELWGDCYSERTGEEPWDEESLDLLCSWFLQEDEELEEYESRPFFYVTEDGEFVVGLSLDPVLYGAITYEPTARILSAVMTLQELSPFKRESRFWGRYERSQTAGEVLPCEDKKENIWLGEGASIWDWEY